MNLAEQSGNNHPESPREFGGVQLSNERSLESRGHSGRQFVYATSVGSRQVVANAGQRKRIVTDTADQVFRLPQLPPGDTGPRMDCVQAGKADEVGRRCWRNVPGLTRLPEHESECWRQGSEFRCGHECKIDLQSAGQQEHPVDPRARLDVEMMNRQVLTIHVLGPIGEDILQFGNIDDAKREVNIQPPVFAFGRCGASDRSATDTPVAGAELQKVGTQSITFFRCEYWCFDYISPSPAGRADRRPRGVDHLALLVV